MRTFHPDIQVVLRRCDIALIRGLNAGIRFAESHGPFGKGSVDRVLGCGAEPNPFISETSCDTARDHRLKHVPRNFKANTVQQFAACAHVLQRAEIAAFMMHTCESVTDELLRYESQAIAVTLFSLIRSERSPGSDAIDSTSCEIRDASRQVT